MMMMMMMMNMITINQNLPLRTAGLCSGFSFSPTGRLTKAKEPNILNSMIIDHCYYGYTGLYIYIYIYMCVCVCVLKSVYLGSKLLLKQVLLKTMEFR